LEKCKLIKVSQISKQRIKLKFNRVESKPKNKKQVCQDSCPCLTEDSEKTLEISENCWFCFEIVPRIESSSSSKRTKLVFRFSIFSSKKSFKVDLSDREARLKMIKNLVIVWFCFFHQMRSLSLKNKQFLAISNKVWCLCVHFKYRTALTKARFGQCKLE